MGLLLHLILWRWHVPYKFPRWFLLSALSCKEKMFRGVALVVQTSKRCTLDNH